MKIRVFDRIISALVAIVLVALSLLLIGMAWHIVAEDMVEQYVYSIYSLQVNSWILTGAAAVVLIFAVGLFFITFARAKKGGKYLDIHTLENGNIRIADSTFIDMVNKNVLSVAGVKDSKTVVKTIDKKLHVFIKAELDEGVVVPEVCAQVQSTVKENMEAMCGIALQKINIVVDNKKKD